MKKSVHSVSRAACGFIFLALTAAATADSVDLLSGGLEAWTNRNGEAPGAGWVLKDGVLELSAKKTGDLWTKDRYGDFTLELEFRTTGNSGVFIRTGDPKNNVQTGLEIQINKPKDVPGNKDVGALYDALAPTKGNARTEWNSMVIKAAGSLLTVVMNGETILEADLDKWDTAGKNPDGSKNKYKKALKDFPRSGHIGFQDHGAKVWYRNVRITPSAD